MATIHAQDRNPVDRSLADIHEQRAADRIGVDRDRRDGRWNADRVVQFCDRDASELGGSMSLRVAVVVV